MKERPILFSTSMVQTILAGAKTQTRGTVKFKKLWNGFGEVVQDLCRHDGPENDQYLRVHYNGNGETDLVTSHRHFCPYGNPGDRRWVRETWTHAAGGASGFRYRADGEMKSPGKWKPSIHMPRIASRITLEITSIRVERLKQISDIDSIAEGTLSIGSYGELWESINGKGSWDANPWVWVIEFKTVSR